MKQRKWTGLTLFCVLLCFAWSAAFAQTETYSDSNVKVTLCTFENDFPQELNEVLQQFGYGESTRVCGAMLVRREVLDFMTRDEKADERQSELYKRWNYSLALCVLEKGGMTWVLGLYQTIDADWRLILASDSVVLPGRSYTFAVDRESSDWRHISFVFTYPREDGRSERYAIKFKESSSQILWYELLDAGGKGLHIENAHIRSYYLIWDLPRAEDDYTGLRQYTCYLPQLLSFGDLVQWHSISDFPTTEEAARRLAEESIAALPREGILIGGFVNLRKKPGTGSASLGRYYSGTIGTLLTNAAKKGWYHVRIGAVEGYISGHYAVPVVDYRNSQMDLVSAPLPIGTIRSDCLLLNSPDEKSIVKASLTQGDRVQVMGVVDEQWLHVTLSPVDAPMQTDAEEGYLPADAVVISGRE